MKAVITILAVVFLVGAVAFDNIICPVDVIGIICFIEPCKLATCPNYTNAVCKNDRCGTCAPRWFYGEEEVTDDC